MSSFHVKQRLVFVRRGAHRAKGARMFDVLVIGGGHAGCEAAAAAARRGARVGLLTFRAEDVGQMSCNPSIGGVGKGHLVRELDVFDGLMARAADRAAIHRRMLNRSKGPAVRGPRVQADRALYRAAIAELARRAAASSVVDRRGAARCGSRAAGSPASRPPTAATRVPRAGHRHRHLPRRAASFVGEDGRAGGRRGERAVDRAWPRSCARSGLAQGRLKTGTPPRLDGRTIDWARLERAAERRATPGRCRRSTTAPAPPQLSARSPGPTPRTHDIIRAAISTARRLFAGAIEGRGPRYCPSIEDKVHRFGDRDGHQIFLEPEGLDDRSGLSQRHLDLAARPTSSCDFVRSDRRASSGPRSSGPAMRSNMTMSIRGGSSRRSRRATSRACSSPARSTARPAMRKRPPRAWSPGSTPPRWRSACAEVRFDRRISYIGVMVDDLTLQGVSEPYRMLTARAEYRLSLRADNATTRLGAARDRAGCVSRAAARRRSRPISKLRGTTAWAETDEGRADALYAPYVERQQREWDAVQRDVARDSRGSGFRDVAGPVDRDGRAPVAGRGPRRSTRRRGSRGHAGGAVGALCRRHAAAPRHDRRLEAAAGRPVSRETVERLEAYVALLKERTARRI